MNLGLRFMQFFSKIIFSLSVELSHRLNRRFPKLTYAGPLRTVRASPPIRIITSKTQKSTLPAHGVSFYITMMLLNVSDISLGVGATYSSGMVDIPAEILSTMSFRITGGTASSVALTVKRTIYIVC